MTMIEKNMLTMIHNDQPSHIYNYININDQRRKSNNTH